MIGKQKDTEDSDLTVVAKELHKSFNRYLADIPVEQKLFQDLVFIVKCFENSLSVAKCFKSKRAKNKFFTEFKKALDTISPRSIFK